MIKALIEIARAIATIKWLYKKIFGVNPAEVIKLREQIREGYKIAKETKDPSAIANAINNRE